MSDIECGLSYVGEVANFYKNTYNKNAFNEDILQY